MLFGTLELSQEKMALVQETLQQIDLFCQNYWFGGPILVFVYALISGYRNRANTRRLTAEKNEAVSRTSASIRNEAERKLVEAKAAKDTAEAEAKDPIKQGQKRVFTSIFDAINLGTALWDWIARDSTLRCKATGFDKLSISVDDTRSSNASKLRFFIGSENVTSTLARVTLADETDGSTLITQAALLVKTKLAELEAIRVHALADQISKPVTEKAEKTADKSIDWAKDTFRPATPEGLLADKSISTEPSAHDAAYANKIFDKLVIMLKDHARWIRTEELGVYMDKSGLVSFRSRSRTDADIIARDNKIIALFTEKQRLALANLCYHKTQSDPHRSAALEAVITTMSNIPV